MKHIAVRTQVYILLPVLILLFPNRWILSWIAAAAIHEGFHLLALYFSGTKIINFEIGISGAKIDTEPIQPLTEFAIALAGPVGALSTLICSKYFPRIAICVIAQSLYNLMPVYPLDGGRALRCLFAGKIKAQHRRTIEKCILCIIAFWCLFIGMSLKLGILPIVFAIGLLIKYRNANIPCKDWTKRVQ